MWFVKVWKKVVVETRGSSQRLILETSSVWDWEGIDGE